MSRKKRILMAGEASFMLSGFGTYSHEVLSRLHATGKYELAEFATYGYTNDPRDHSVKWKYYANAVREDDQRHNEYKADPINQFGKWRFERVLLDFKPDIVWDIRDYWMMSYEYDSPLRPFFHWAIMPTVDSAPQKTDWIETYLGADGVFTYSDWNKKILDKESNHNIKTLGSAPPAVDTSVFCPPESVDIQRQKFGMLTGVNIVGTVMRNQRRKLYPDLFIAFKKFLDICEKEGKQELADKTYLYVHTSYPDVGWNLPLLLKETGIGHKVIFTYVCRNCKQPSCAFFQDARSVCPHCKSVAAVLPSVAEGLSSAELAEIYKMFDLYIQYSICEGFGMPQVEAASCGIPVMAVDYSAMEDVVRKTKGTPLKVQRLYREADSHAWRALPDNDYCARKLYEHFCQSDADKQAQRDTVRKATLDTYSWDKTAKIWERYFDGIEPVGLQGQWDSPMRMKSIPPTLPEGMTNAQFTHWLHAQILQQPEKINSYSGLAMVRDLNHGATLSGNKLSPISQQQIFKHATNKVRYFNECEQARMNIDKLPRQDFIEYAMLKESLR